MMLAQPGRARQTPRAIRPRPELVEGRAAHAQVRSRGTCGRHPRCAL